MATTSGKLDAALLQAGAVLATGALLSPAMGFPGGRGLLGLAAAALAARALARASSAHPARARVAVVAGGAAGLVAVGVGLAFGGRTGDGTLLAGFYALFLVLAFRPGARPARLLRVASLVGTHAVVSAGIVGAFVAGWQSFPVLLTLAVGFPILGAHAYWAQRDGRLRVDEARSRPWERILLLGSMAATLSVGWLGWAAADADGWRVAGGAGLAVLLGTLAIVGAPPPLPRALHARPGSLGQILVQSAATAFFLNSVALVLMLATPLAVDVVVAATLAWLLVSSTLEYVATARARAPRPPSPAAAASLADVTVVISAFQEEAVLRGTIASALALDPAIRLLLVPAAKGKDGTVALCEATAAQAPDRVAVAVGTSGSKAGDLNAAWPRVRTPFALLLDADESVTREGLLAAVARLTVDPTLGVVQGRKRARSPGADRVARFANPERRFSTLLDQTLQADLFHAAHFAGSGALLRREVPVAVGGWREEALTEDIELTLRLHLAGSPRIAYDLDLDVPGADPATWRALGRQRTRWARGWAQVMRWHLTTLWARAPRLGARRTFGLSWQLLTSVSATWSVFLPALVLATLLVRPPAIPVPLALALLVYILPSRGLAYVRAARLAPEAPRDVADAFRAAGAAYGWLVVGLMIQLHAVYLEWSEAPGTWWGTDKAPAAGTAGSP